MPDAAHPPKLLDRVRHACRVRHDSIRTEDAYHDWCRRFILFHNKQHPQEMGAAESAARGFARVERGSSCTGACRGSWSACGCGFSTSTSAGGN